MTSRRRGGLLGTLVLLAVVLGAGWLFRDRIAGMLGGGREKIATTVSPESAALAEAKIKKLQEDGQTVRLSDAELTSLMRYRFRDRIPGDIYAPAVAFRGDTVRMQGRVPSDRLPDVPELGRVRAFLPDTADVDIIGRLRARESGRSAFQVERIIFAGIPIPPRFYPKALEQMGRRDEPGLPGDAYAFKLPDGVGSARVEGGYLVLSPSQ
ncbi:MAG: hypothetical protein JO040_07505 [Gemmatimonadetes bacterium]|nr:hypothetical protein [Gemmatimonadota bacterium]